MFAGMFTSILVKMEGLKDRMDTNTSLLNQLISGGYTGATDREESSQEFSLHKATDLDSFKDMEKKTHDPVYGHTMVILIIQ